MQHCEWNGKGLLPTGECKDAWWGIIIIWPCYWGIRSRAVAKGRYRILKIYRGGPRKPCFLVKWLTSTFVVTTLRSVFECDFQSHFIKIVSGKGVCHTPRLDKPVGTAKIYLQTPPPPPPPPPVSALVVLV